MMYKNNNNNNNKMSSYTRVMYRYDDDDDDDMMSTTAATAATSSATTNLPSGGRLEKRWTKSSTKRRRRKRRKTKNRMHHLKEEPPVMPTTIDPATTTTTTTTTIAATTSVSDYLTTTTKGPANLRLKEKNIQDCAYIYAVDKHDISPGTAAEVARGLIPTVYYKAVKGFSMPPHSNSWWFLWLYFYNKQQKDKELNGLVILRNTSKFNLHVPAGSNLRALLRLPAGFIDFQVKYLVDPHLNRQRIPPPPPFHPHSP